MPEATQDERSELERNYHELYAKYGKPLEPEHWGEFLAISARGEFLLAPTFDEAADNGVARFGPGIYVYRVGKRAALKWR